jgi:hypothetical protein
VHLEGVNQAYRVKAKVQISRTGNQCCGPGSGWIRTFLPDPNTEFFWDRNRIPDPRLQNLHLIYLFGVEKYYENIEIHLC